MFTYIVTLVGSNIFTNKNIMKKKLCSEEVGLKEKGYYFNYNEKSSNYP